MHQDALEFLQQLINGLSIGAIYALIAVGYTMVYGVLRLINFAHGDIYMVGAMMGAYIGTGRFNLLAIDWWWNPLVWLAAWLVVLGLLVLLRRPPGAIVMGIGTVLLAASAAVVGADVTTRLVRLLELPSAVGFLLTLTGAMVVCGALGYVIELLAYRSLRNQPRITALITAIGVSMFLEFGGQRVFGATPQSFPEIVTSRQFNIGGVTIGVPDIMIFGVTIVLMTGLALLVKYTQTGRALRAVSFRFDTAALMGINVNRIVSFTFVLGSILAAAAGILVAVRSPKVEPLMGLLPGLKAFIAAVLGGIGNIPGAVAGGLLLGLTETLVAGYLPQGSQYRDGVAFVILIGVLLVKPSGLFGQNVVEKV